MKKCRTRRCRIRTDNDFETDVITCEILQIREETVSLHALTMAALYQVHQLSRERDSPRIVEYTRSVKNWTRSGLIEDRVHSHNLAANMIAEGEFSQASLLPINNSSG